MAYTPDPTDASQPVESVIAKTAAAEFRALKAYLASIVINGGPINAIGRLINVRQIAVSTTYFSTPGTTSIIAEMIGAGGAAGGTPVTGAGQVALGAGGAAGGYVMHRATAGFDGQPIVIGAAGGSVVGGPGLAGGNTTFLGVTATGGNGGPSSSAAATAAVNGLPGGSGFGGNILNIQGQSGGSGVATFASGFVLGTMGGPSKFGYANTNSVCGIGNANPGQSATGRGAGGNGAVAGASQAAQAGGGGADGLVLIFEYT